LKPVSLIDDVGGGRTNTASRAADLPDACNKVRVTMHRSNENIHMITKMQQMQTTATFDDFIE